MLSKADGRTIRAREVRCIDSTAGDVGCNGELEAGGGSRRELAGVERDGRGRGGRGGGLAQKAAVVCYEKESC